MSEQPDRGDSPWRAIVVAIAPEHIRERGSVETKMHDEKVN